MADEREGGSSSPSNFVINETSDKEVEEDINLKLEARAEQTNLSVANVKSILHHILKDKRVIAMAKKLAHEQDPADSDIEIAPFEPRLTRSRVREAVISSISEGNFSPDKLSSLTLPSTSSSATKGPSNVLDNIFHEEEDDEEEDEEYSPGKESNNINEETLIESECEMEEEDTEVEEEGEERDENKETDSNTASLTHKQTLTEAYDDETAAQEAASLLASLSDVNFTPCKTGGLHLATTTVLPPLEVSTDQHHEQSEIAHRTRSKLPLTDTDIQDIEASFNPPDVPSDEEEEESQGGVAHRELDEEELEWQRWLADLMNPQDVELQAQDDTEDDTEYNFWAEKNQDYEKEEFRTDRGVKIPQREVDELIEELLNPTTSVIPASGIIANSSNSMYCGDIGGNTDLTSAYLLESLGLRPPVLSHGQVISSQQRTPLRDRRRDTSVTINDQNSSMNDKEKGKKKEEGEKEEELGTRYLNKEQSLQVWNQLQQHFQLLMQTFVMSRFEPTLVFLSQITSQAIVEIGRWCKEATEEKNSCLWYVPGIEEGMNLVTKYNPHDNTAVELTTTYGNPPKVPNVVQDIIMNQEIFWNYPEFLPTIGLSPLESNSSQGSKYFTTSEDYLLVLGMDHYGASSWKLIQEKLLPTKTTKQLHLRVKNLSSARTKQDNVIKHYKRTGQVKIPFDSTSSSSTGGSTNSEESNLPEWIIKYHIQRKQMEEKEKQKKDRHLEELQRILKTDSHSSSNSKRNLTDDLLSVEESKRPKFADIASSSSSSGVRKGKRGIKQKIQTSLGPFQDIHSLHTPIPDADYKQLLYMAGLEGSDPAARYAFNYLTEVKATVMNEPNKYKTFVQLLMEARKKDWSPGKLYMAVKPVLKKWPHLLKLFMAFLDPKDAIQANVIADKIDFDQVKAFIKKLQDKYSGNPFELEVILSKLRHLESDVSSRHQVMSELISVMKTQEDLLYDLRHFVTGMLPAKKIASSDYDDFEEITLPFSSDTKLVSKDDYEEVVIPDDWTPQNYSSISPPITRHL